MTVALNTLGQIAAREDLAIHAVVPATIQIVTGSTEQGYVVMNRDVDGDTVVAIASDDAGIASVPASVTVLAGEMTAAFDITAGTPGSTTIRATYAAVEKTASVVSLGTFTPTYVPQITGNARELRPSSGTGVDLRPSPYSAEEQ